MKITMFRKWQVVAVLFVATGISHANDSISANSPALQSPTSEIYADTPPVPLDLSQLPVIEDIELLSINDEIKAILDREISHVSSMRDRAFTLHELLFRPYFLGITYDDQKTFTAQETFDRGVGNCISHASLFIAAARHVGLKAKFQVVDVPRDWVDQKRFYIVPGHINVAVYIPGNKITVEFSDAYMAHTTRFFKSRPISDTRALAEYYNNIGMQHMQTGNYRSAIAYMKKSTDTYSRVGFVWSNLGVAYKLNGHFDLAQAAYEKGLRLDNRNMSIINNAYILYYQTGQYEKANKLAKKVERYSKKNPYYLSKLAAADIKMQNYSSALLKLKKAIRKKPEETEFYVSLAQVYYAMGEHQKGYRQLELAQSYAEDETQFNRFQRKLDLLKQYHAGL